MSCAMLALYLTFPSSFPKLTTNPFSLTLIALSLLFRLSPSPFDRSLLLMTAETDYHALAREVDDLLRITMEYADECTRIDQHFTDTQALPCALSVGLRKASALVVAAMDHMAKFSK